MHDPAPGALLTDLYQLTMLDAYFEHGLTRTAVFEFFVRRLPDARGFLVAAGLEQALDYLETLRFTDDELDWIRASGHFSPGFADRLAALRFTGDVDALPEGTVCFANEPLLRIVAPLPEAQLVETRLINLLQFQTMIASKAARSVLAANGRQLVEFGLRRAHGAEAGLFAARASYLAGFAGTSNVAAAARYGMPAFGTMAHAFVQAHDDEEQAFEHFAVTHPDNNTLLIDTYDTEAAARKVVSLAGRLRARGITIRAVRLDSGNLLDHAVRVRRILDDGGLRETRIFSSGNLDEYVLRDLVREGAPIDGFGIGTSLDTSADAPYLECVYKLMEYDGRARRKRSEGKATWPGRKQVFRRYGPSGEMAGDVLTVDGDAQEGEALLVPVMRGGRRLAPRESLHAIRARAVRQLGDLPAHLQALETEPAYLVRVAPALVSLTELVDRTVAPG
ncbi:MAG: nicotinate phosphoribosyltransferase [Acidobacteriota bacterium]